MGAHFAAFKLLLLAVVMLANKVHTSVRITDGKPVRENYVVLFPDAPNELDDQRYTAHQSAASKARYRYDVRVVATSAEGLLQLADAVLSIIGGVPIVAGRSCDPVSLVAGVEEGKARHDSVADLHYIDMSFEFWSRRA